MIITGATISGARVVDGSILTQNLAIWIDANNASSYPGTGTTVTDLSGNGRTQNLASAAQYTVLNGVKCFDCNSNSLTAASAVPTLPTTGFTYISWARMKSSSADWRTLFRCTPNDHPILIELGSNRLGMYDNTANAFFPAGYTVENLANTWVQWAVTGDSSGQTFYINGQQVGTVAGHTAAGNSHNYIGNISNTQGFGYIANAYLYSVKLSAEDIFRHYWSVKQRLGI